MKVYSPSMLSSHGVNFSKRRKEVSDDQDDRKDDSKHGLLDKFETEVKRPSDLNDTVEVPRTIFKGYLAFTAGTALPAIASFTKTKLPKITKFLNASAAALVIYGTYCFVKPYLSEKDK